MLEPGSFRGGTLRALKKPWEVMKRSGVGWGLSGGSDVCCLLQGKKEEGYRKGQQVQRP